MFTKELSSFLLVFLTLLVLLMLHKCSSQESDYYFDPVPCNATVNFSACSNYTCSLNIPSLDYEISTDIDSIRIQLCTSYSELSTVVKFNNVSRVELRGNSVNWSEVNCTGTHTGIQFVRVRSIQIENFLFSGCGMDISYSAVKIEMASVYIFGSAQVALNNIIFMSSKDFAVVMLNVRNSSTRNCTFRGLHHNEFKGSRGLYIEIGKNNTYHEIHGSHFIANKRVTTPCSIKFPTTPLYGAGLTLLLQNNSIGNLVEISKCNFKQNFAKQGGAFRAKINSSSDNSILVTKSEFYQNEATEMGGAIAVEFTSLSTNNEVKIIECNFTINNASKGGSLHIISTVPPPCRGVQNKVELENSMFIHNTAFKGAAIDAGLRFFDVEGEFSSDNYNFIFIKLDNAKFENNSAKAINKTRQSLCRGTIRTVKGIQLSVSGTLQMSNNTGSALCLESSIVNFMPNSETIFQGNDGRQGGAIAIMGETSQVKVHDNCSILFQGNTAITHGGAIFQEFSEKCFLAREGGEDIMKPFLKFSNNTAKKSGHSIYVATFQSCYMDVFFHTIDNTSKFLPNIANFSFTLRRTSEVSTKSGNIMLLPEKLAPGEVANLVFKDETSTITDAVFIILSANNASRNSNVFLEDSLIPNTGNSQIRFLGRPGSKTNLLVSTLNQPDIQVSLTIELAECPPGFYYDPHRKACLCSANSPNASNRYVGIANCPLNTFQASLLHGHWAGYVTSSSSSSSSNESEDEVIFLTGYCPRGFCVGANMTTITTLPAHVPSNYDLSATVCHKNREGILCSQCVSNHSASFTTYRQCLPDEKCRLGFVYYFLSQIVPITIVFSIMIASDTSFTNGAVSGVIFYAQIFQFLLITANDFIWFDQNSFKLLKGFRLIIRMFNLRFFAIREVSFCLWKGITLLDIVAINHVTVAYSLVLVILTVKVFTPCIRKLKNYRSRVHKEAAKKSPKSIIHGLTGFLVVCYSQCTTMSLYIMAYVRLYGIGMKKSKYRVFYDAELEFFKGKHLFYAIPALFFFVFVSLIPPLFLFSYPLCYRVLALCRIQESRFTRILCRAIPLEKYKPLFDSFQESYKDKHRYFAGLYFIFRLVIIITFMTTRELASYYLVLEIELVIMLVLVTYFQPHKKDWHNVLDTLIFFLLICINTGTIFTYHRRSEHSKIKHGLETTGTWQVILAYLPLLYLLAYAIFKGITTVRKLFTKKGRSLDEDENELAFSGLSQHASPTKSEYLLFQERERSH